MYLNDVREGCVWFGEVLKEDREGCKLVFFLLTKPNEGLPVSEAISSVGFG